jgi:hypothetical protein
MTTYHLNRIMYLLHTDPDFLQRFRQNADEALASFPLAAAEARALKRGDVATLFRVGVHPFLLHGFVRQRLCGIDQPTYMAQVRQAAESLELERTRQY